MFEHFGLRDIFSTIRRYIKIILIIFVAVTILAVANGAAKISKAEKSNNNLEDSYYFSTTSFSVTPNVKATDTNISAYNSYPSKFASELNADFSKKYVYDKIMEKYTPEEVIKNITSLNDLNIDSDNLNMYYMDKIAIAKQYESSMVVQVYVETKNKDFSKDVVNIYTEYVENNYANKSEDLKIEHIDTINNETPISVDVIKSLNDGDESKTINESLPGASGVSVKRIILKSVIFPIILVAFLMCIVIFVIALFNPTLNRRSDFFLYDLPVTCELYMPKLFKNRRK